MLIKNRHKFNVSLTSFLISIFGISLLLISFFSWVMINRSGTELISEKVLQAAHSHHHLAHALFDLETQEQFFRFERVAGLESLRVAIEENDRNAASLALNSIYQRDQRFPLNFFYISRGENADWANLNLSIHGRKQLVEKIQKLPSNFSESIISLDINGKESHYFVLTAPVTTSLNESVYLRGAVSLNQNSEFLRHIMHKTNSECIGLVVNQRIEAIVGDQDCWQRYGRNSFDTISQTQLQNKTAVTVIPIPWAIVDNNYGLTHFTDINYLLNFGSTLKKTLVQMVLGALLILMLGYFISKKIIGRHIQKLNAYSKEIVENKNLEAPEGVIAEFNMISSAIDKMVINLNESEKVQMKALSSLMKGQKLQSLGTLTGGVAHDFNNVLGIIRGNLELITMDDLANDKKNELANQAIQAVDRGVSITQQLLTYAGRKSIHPKTVDLVKLLQESMVLFRHAADPTHHVKLNINLDQATAYIDSSLFVTAMLNMIQNSKMASKEGGEILIQLDVNDPQYSEMHDENEFWCVTIKDDGPGFDDEIKDKVFEPFFTTKDVDQGTGLGLSMVQGFMQLSGGGAFIKNPEKGAEIQLILPIHFENDSELTVSENDIVAFQQTRKFNKNQPLTVFLVDDNPEVLRTLTLLVNTIGCEVYSFSSADEVRKALIDKRKCDVIISDVVMPRENGLSLYKYLRKNFPSIRVLLMSGYVSQDLIPEVSSLIDEQDYLVKPFTKNQLEEAIYHS